MTYFISSIEGAQPKYRSDRLGNTRLSSKHYGIEFVFCVQHNGGGKCEVLKIARVLTTTGPRSYGIETKRDERPLVSSNKLRFCIRVYLKAKISIAL